MVSRRRPVARASGAGMRTSFPGSSALGGSTLPTSCATSPAKRCIARLKKSFVFRRFKLLQKNPAYVIHDAKMRPASRAKLKMNPIGTGKLAGFTLLFEALIRTMCRQMPCASVARMVGESGIGSRRFASATWGLPGEGRSFNVTMLAMDETSSRRGHNYLTFAADAEARKVVFVTEGRDANTVAELSQFLSEHKAELEEIASVSIDMSPAFIKGVSEHLPNARITFDKFHVIAHASTAVDKTGASNRKPIPVSRACAGRCSRTVCVCRKPTGRSRCFRHADHDKAHRPRLALSRTTA